MNEDELRERFEERRKTYLIEFAEKLKEKVKGYVIDIDRIDQITARAKDVDSFIEKSKKLDEEGHKKYSDPLNDIQDQIGVRIICFYKEDALRIEEFIDGCFTSAEKVIKEPEGDLEFGYFGIHLLMSIPFDIRSKTIPKDECPEYFELQIKTLFQHAWSQANHDLAYKQDKELSKEQKRNIAFTSAQSWGADEIFNRLAKELVPDFCGD